MDQSSDKSKAETGEAIVWDNDIVIKAYDKSIHLAKEDVAKRIANSTNTIKQNPTQESKVDTSAGERTLSWEPVSRTFKPGDFCRVTYKKDGIDYEAVVVSVNEINQNCLIKFLGYGNEQYSKMEDLLPSWGEEFRTDQIEQATEEAGESSDEDVDSNATTCGEDNPGDLTSKNRSSKKNKSKQLIHPQMPFMCPPMPPIPASSNSDNDALHAMLMSWYMSGYYTGLYDAQQQQQQKQRKRKSK